MEGNVVPPVQGLSGAYVAPLFVRGTSPSLSRTTEERQPDLVRSGPLPQTSPHGSRDRWRAATGTERFSPASGVAVHGVGGAPTTPGTVVVPQPVLHELVWNVQMLQQQVLGLQVQVNQLCLLLQHERPDLVGEVSAGGAFPQQQQEILSGSQERHAWDTTRGGSVQATSMGSRQPGYSAMPTAAPTQGSAHLHPQPGSWRNEAVNKSVGVDLSGNASTGSIRAASAHNQSAESLPVPRVPTPRGTPQKEKPHFGKASVPILGSSTPEPDSSELVPPPTHRTVAQPQPDNWTSAHTVQHEGGPPATMGFVADSGSVFNRILVPLTDPSHARAGTQQSAPKADSGPATTAERKPQPQPAGFSSVPPFSLPFRSRPEPEVSQWPAAVTSHPSPAPTPAGPPQRQSSIAAALEHSRGRQEITSAPSALQHRSLLGDDVSVSADASAELERTPDPKVPAYRPTAPQQPLDGKATSTPVPSPSKISSQGHFGTSSREATPSGVQGVQPKFGGYRTPSGAGALATPSSAYTSANSSTMSGTGGVGSGSGLGPPSAAASSALRSARERLSSRQQQRRAPRATGDGGGDSDGYVSFESMQYLESIGLL